MAGAYNQLSAENRRKVDRLLADTKANGGLAPLDIEAFWKDQKLARANPFGADIPQVLFGAICGEECIFDELGIEQDSWRFDNDKAWALEISRQYNDRAERIVGRRLLSETPPQPAELAWPAIKGLHDIFEGENVWEGGKNGSWCDDNCCLFNPDMSALWPLHLRKPMGGVSV